MAILRYNLKLQFMNIGALKDVTVLKVADLLGNETFYGCCLCSFIMRAESLVAVAVMT